MGRTPSLFMVETQVRVRTQTMFSVSFVFVHAGIA